MLMNSSQLADCTYHRQINCIGRIGRTATLQPHSSSAPTQHRDTEQATDPVGQQIVPSGRAAGQGHLVPFVQDTDQNHRDERRQNHAPTAQAGGQPDCCCHQAIDAGVRQLVPGRGYQSDSDRSGPENKKTEHGAYDKSSGERSQMSFKNVFGQADDHRNLVNQVNAADDYLRIRPRRRARATFFVTFSYTAVTVQGELAR